MTVYSNPASWGPPAWVFLHCISLTYPKKPSKRERLHYQEFFESLGHVLPCPSCRQEYQKWIMSHPIEPHLMSRTKLTNWVIKLHNDVNFRNQKSTVASQTQALQMVVRNCRRYKKIGQDMNPKK